MGETSQSGRAYFSEVEKIDFAGSPSAGRSGQTAMWLIFLSKKGARRHRMVGAIYLVLMTVTATAAIFIRDLRDGSFSFLHLFVLLTYWSVFSAIWNLRRHNIRGHQGAMIGLYVGGILVAGGLTFLPTRTPEPPSVLRTEGTYDDLDAILARLAQPPSGAVSASPSGGFRRVRRPDELDCFDDGEKSLTTESGDHGCALLFHSGTIGDTQAGIEAHDGPGPSWALRRPLLGLAVQRASVLQNRPCTAP